MDADQDGYHIATLLLTLLSAHETLIDHGHIYLAQPPLYRVIGNKTHWVSDDRRQDFEKSVPKNSISRFKGLEGNAKTLFRPRSTPKTHCSKSTSLKDLP